MVSNRGPFMTSFSKVLQNRFKVIYLDQATIKTFKLPAIWNFKRSNPILQLIFQNFGIFVSFVTSLPPNWVKRARSYISRVEGYRNIKINIWWNLKVNSLFLRSLSQNTAKFWLTWWLINPNLGQKEPKLVLHVQMMIERCNSLVKRNLSWSNRFLAKMNY